LHLLLLWDAHGNASILILAVGCLANPYAKKFLGMPILECNGLDDGAVTLVLLTKSPQLAEADFTVVATHKVPPFFVLFLLFLFTLYALSALHFIVLVDEKTLV
jgi:hypothetical protein